ncbi:MAG: hypothetical protein MNPFHGCM_00984 [Gemmatimonadaceae bacterium]|nr:hypothetical protein [Gemmatimonadaceae bacterium]
MTEKTVTLPKWAIVSEKRLAHIERVTSLLDRWSNELGLPRSDRQAWHDAGAWHDVYRDASDDVLRAELGADPRPVSILHGPAAAHRLEREGETRRDVLDAIRWHTLGNPDWGRTGRALFMADFLEPGRQFMMEERARLAERVPRDFDRVFQQVVRARLEWTLREGKPIFPETVALWNHLRRSDA